MSYPLTIILGATASGKTKLAVSVASALNAEIISADSRQVFKQMDIGTGKDLADYHAAGVPYHLIDILEPGARYHVDAFKNDFREAYLSITNRGKLPILCGGTGMYIHSLLQTQPYTAIPVNVTLREELELLSKEDLTRYLSRYKDQYTQHADLSSKKRLIRAIEVAGFLTKHSLPTSNDLMLKPLVFGLQHERSVTRGRILKRLGNRLEDGMIEEVEMLMKQGISKEMLVFYGLEYKFIASYLAGELSYEELTLKLGIAICQYAKRQNTFFRKMEKDGVQIHWLDATRPVEDLREMVISKMRLEKVIAL